MERCLVLLDIITEYTQVLEGQDPVTEELGPYVYSATHLRRIVEVRQSVMMVLPSHACHLCDGY